MEINLSDFVKDFRRNDHWDDHEWPFNGKLAAVEFSECNKLHLAEKFSQIKDSAKAILEIGVCKNASDSSNYIFFKNKNQNTIYIGVDLLDKSFLNNKEQNIYTLQTDSSNYEFIMSECAKLGVFEFDFIFIDGYHSINQCIKDWKFVDNLSDHGIVGLHDTSNHPGPLALVENINKDKWNLEVYCFDDNGIAFFTKKN